MTSCLNILQRIQRVTGGGVVYLECENEKNVCSFINVMISDFVASANVSRRKVYAIINY